MINKKAKGTKKCVIKRKIKFEHYENCLGNNENISKLQQKFRSEAYNVFTLKVNKIALSSNDDKRLQTFDGVTSYSYGTGAGRVQKRIVIVRQNE